MTVQVGKALTLDDVVAVARHGVPVEIAPGARDRIDAARAIVDRAARGTPAVYGINTGVGNLATVRIDAGEATALQRALVRSHASGTGPHLSNEVVRAMLLLKARTFSFGHSGVRFEIVERLVEMLNTSILPVVPGQGSLGASGDLAPLAHLALPIIGEGKVWRDGRVEPAVDALRAEGLDHLELSHKEGISLINGTEGMLACGILALDAATTIARAADVTAAMSIEACFGTPAAFREDVVSLRRHPGALRVARNLTRLLERSAIAASHRESEHLVQDAYSLRCTPQVHGAYRDGMAYVRSTLQAELESAVDNPSVLPATSEVISSGNFHGEALGLALDHLGLCSAGLGTIAERRINRLVDASLSNGLPPFLTRDAGRQSGFMIPHYTAAALVAENRNLCVPASADSIPTSAGQEDHVSMGATSGRKALVIAENARRVIAIEALTASQGLDLREMDPSPATAAVRACVRAVSPHLDADRSLTEEIEAVADLIGAGALQEAAEKMIGPLD